MIKFDFSNLFAEKVGGEDGLCDEDIAALERLAPDAHKKIEGWRKTGDAFFFDIAGDDSILSGIRENADDVSKNFDNVVVLGIGGSALGTKCLANALLPPFWNLLSPKERKGRPKIFVCDNTDPDTFSALLELVGFKKTCFVVISKSGKTLETAAQFFVVIRSLKKIIGRGWQKNLVIITDPAAGELRPFAAKEGIRAFPIPPKLGGRFSVLSAVGLFPAACVGIDVGELLGGARSAAKRCSGIENNAAYQIGGYHHLLCARKKKTISVMMPYSDALALFADWYSQLWAESLGKEGKGQTPIKALGATDQHSALQLYMDGPNDKVVTFIGVEKRGQVLTFDFDEVITVKVKSQDLTPFSFGKIINAEREATAGALAKAKRPNMTVLLPLLDAQNIGELLMTYEIATAFTGALMGVNPFDQPAVEIGKKIAREILQKS